MRLIPLQKGDYVAQPDPYLIKGNDGKFYMYVTGVDGVHAFVSDTLTKGYQHAGIVFAVPGKKEYWAPSVLFTNGKYYMYVSFMDENEEDVHQEALHVASADSPLGPFENVKPLTAPFSIDAHAVENENGLFLFYSVNDYEAERAGTYIVVDRLLTPEKVAGNPRLVLRATLDEEIFCRDRFKKGQHWHTLEGAFYFYENGYHYLIYSGNCYQNEYYYLGYAVAKTDEKDLTAIEFKKYPNEKTYAPLIAANEFEAGTGHNSLISVDGTYYVIYHGRELEKDPNTVGDDRTARICRLQIEGERLTAIRHQNKL